ncbi:hypothetical protein [Streptomyces sp. NPDC051576]|uniref:hypothetical protein n=1 Tax=Streptomyces sp. NPDC051576 TaxID=3155803 RepID=UPI003448D890
MSELQHDAGLPALLGAALRGSALDDEAQGRAVAAFRAARDSGSLCPHTRQQDDWSPGARGEDGEPRRWSRPGGSGSGPGDGA